METQREWQLPVYLFKQGTNFESWRLLGAHFGSSGGCDGVFFRVWAPAARAVSVVGDFNGWNADASPCENLEGSGIWQTFVPGLARYDAYQFCVTEPSGRRTWRADPFAFHSQTRPGKASKIYDLGGYSWGDGAWCAARTTNFDAPMNIYELHAGSWRTYEDGNTYSYRELADQLVEYLCDLGYTHVELMPLTEYPFDGSWGYQVTGYFAPTSRYGAPEDLMYLVDRCHRAGIGVIMDWVPAHFPKDEFGLYRFDGSSCYEDSIPWKSEHKEWGTMVFDFGKPEVQSFLISSALFWLQNYHVDGLRVDAVASMLYLDYCRRGGEWQPNIHGGNENLEAVAFLQKLNTVVRERVPSAMMIAEESTAWAGVTHPVQDGGLGFHYKWNMGWMNDTLSYMSTDPYFRAGAHGKLTFSFMYAFSEHFILPLSHDEVVHGKGSLIGKMPGEYDDKFANLRAYYGYAMAHPGKKLLFMGQEFGQFQEWSEARQLDWMLLGYDRHRQLQEYCRQLNRLYRDTPAFWQQEEGWEGTEFLVADDNLQNTVIFARRACDGSLVVAVCSFSGATVEQYTFGVPGPGLYQPILSSDEERFGGKGRQEQHPLRARRRKSHGRDYSLTVRVPALSTSFYYLPGDGSKKP